jgi:Family of unknown function (DUF5325)
LNSPTLSDILDFEKKRWNGKMKKINWPMLLLAFLVISMFIGVGIAIAYRNIWLVILFLVLACVFMGTGISFKKKRK